MKIKIFLIISFCLLSACSSINLDRDLIYAQKIKLLDSLRNLPNTDFLSLELIGSNNLDIFISSDKKFVYYLNYDINKMEFVDRYYLPYTYPYPSYVFQYINKQFFQDCKDSVYLANKCTSFHHIMGFPKNYICGKIDGNPINLYIGINDPYCYDYLLYYLKSLIYDIKYRSKRDGNEW